jgi:amino acid adenylation domain-containing protein
MNERKLNKRNVEDIYPLTPLQEAILFHRELAPESPLYWNRLGLAITGDLRPDLYQQAWQHIVDCLPVLRTGFVRSKAGRALQVVHRSVAIDWHYEDLTNASPDDVERRLSELREFNDRRPPKLNQPPLIRVVVVCVGACDYRLLWWQHHIVLDGWSWPIVLQRVFEAYEDLTRGRTPDRDLGPEFAKFVAWLGDQNTQTAEAYWVEFLADFENSTRIVAADQDFVSHGFPGRCKTIFSKQDSDGLRRYAKAERITVNTVVQGAWALSLGTESACADVVFGAALALRHAEVDCIEDMVGMTLATIPMRVRDDPDSPTGDWLRELQARFQESVSHAHLPLTDIIKGTELSAAAAPFDSAIVFENFPFDAGITGRCTSLEAGELDATEGTQFPLTLTVLPLEQFTFELTYQSERIDEERARRIFDRFLHLLEAIVASDEATVGGLERLLPGEREQALTHLCGPATKQSPGSVLDLIAEKVRLGGSRTAVVFGPSEMTYAELWSSSQAVADALAARGVKPGDVVGIGMERSADMVPAILGVWQAGAAYVPLDPTVPKARIESIVRQAQPVLIIVDAASGSQFEALGAPPVQTGELIKAGDPARLGDKWNSDPRAYVMFTSGSTGVPNGVEVLHDGVVNLLESMRREPGCDEHDRLLAVTTLAFDISVLELFMPLVSGGTTIIADADSTFDGKKLMKLLERSRATIMQATPSTWTMLVESGWTGSPELKALCGGEPLSKQLATSLLPRVSSLWNLYGPTETTIWSTCAHIECHDAVHIGAPIASTELRVLDEERRDLPFDVVGELYIGGRGVSRGYLNNPELTAARFVALDLLHTAERRWFKTGDLVSLSADGELRFHGRVDSQIKLRGFRIEIGEIESHLSEAPGVAKVAVTRRSGENSDERLIAFVVPEDSQRVDAPALRQHLQDRLPQYMVPQHFVAIDALPLTQNRKIDYRRLPKVEFFAGDSPSGRRPKTENERCIAAMWCELLGTDTVSLDDNFFELGGHSLLLARLARRMELAFKSEFKLADLLHAPTVEGHAKIVAGNRGEQRGDIIAAADRSRFPMSSIQKRLWFLEQFEAAAGVNNIVALYRLKDDVDVDRLREAFSEVASRHEILRTVLKFEAGEPLQNVLEEAEFDWIRETLDDRAALQRRLSEQAAHRFDLGAKPPWRVYLGQLEGEHRLLLVVHHALLDGASLRVMLDEVAASYRGEPAATGSPQYGDFSAWQQARLESGEYESGLAFWESELRGPLPVLNFPSFVARPPDQRFAGDTRSLTLDEPIVRSIRRLAADRGSSPFSVLIAAYCALLLRYSGQDSIVVGTPVGTIRYEIGADKALGPYLNTVALHVGPEPESSFGALIDHVSEKCKRAFSHADVPFEEIVRSLKLPVDTSRTPVFQTLFAYQSDIDSVQIPSFCEAQERVPWTRARTDLACWVTDHETQIGIEIEYASELISGSVIEGFLAYFKNFLEVACARADDDWRRIPILSDDEVDNVLGRHRRRVTNSDASIPAVIQRACGQHMDRIAISDSEQALTYRELAERSDRVAAGLGNRGIAHGDIVGLSVSRTVRLPVALLGILKAGSSYMPIDPDLPVTRQRHILENSGARYIVTDASASAESDVALLDLDTLESEDASLFPVPVEETDLAYVMYTSGSTGRPKGVEVSHRAVVNLLTAFRELTSIDSDDVFASVTTISFDISVLELLLPLSVGARLHIVDEQTATDGRRLVSEIEQTSPSLMQATPATWQMLVDANWPSAPNLDILCGGEALPVSLAKALKARCKRLWNVYGPTETTVWSSIAEVPDDPQSIVIGKPIRNTRLYVLDEAGGPVPVGVEGEIFIAGDGVAQGYRRQPGLTAERFLSDPWHPGERMYRTGDSGRLLADGNLEHMGRMDSQIKLRGFRIEAGDIESNLMDAPGVSAVAVTKRKAPGGDDRLVAYVVTTDGIRFDPIQLRRHVRERLPQYMIPQHFVSLDTLPLTPNRKVDYIQLPELSEAGFGGRKAEPPQTASEKLVAEVWADVLGISDVSRSDNFMEMGGHSLLTIMVIARLAERTGVELGPQDLFSRTLEGIAAQLEANARTATEESSGDGQLQEPGLLQKFLGLIARN